MKRFVRYVIWTPPLLLAAGLVLASLLCGCAGLETRQALGTMERFSRTSTGDVEATIDSTADQIMAVYRGPKLVFDDNGEIVLSKSVLSEYFYRESKPSTEAAVAFSEAFKANAETIREALRLVATLAPLALAQNAGAPTPAPAVNPPP